MSFDEVHESRTNTGYGSISPQVHRSKSVKRKDAARKCLIGSINTRFCDTKHSSPKLSGEPMRHDIKFPTVSSKDKTLRGNFSKPAKSEHRSNNSQSSSRALTHSADISEDTRSQDLLFKTDKLNGFGKTSSHGVNLPEIIMEFNIETSMATNGDRFVFSRASSETPEDERALGAPYEDYLRKPKHSVYNPCRAKYRPVTPGLLESLNKLKVPSKVKTEQWLKSTQYLQKPHCGHVYKTEHLNSSFPNWIYTDT